MGPLGEPRGSHSHDRHLPYHCLYEAALHEEVHMITECAAASTVSPAELLLVQVHCTNERK